MISLTGRRSLPGGMGSGPVEWINPGRSAIVDPDGKMLAQSVGELEEILFAEINPANFRGPRFQLDVAGHYARPDLFELTVHRQPRLMIRVREEGGLGEAPSEN